jgi:hypothetical protein
MNEWLGQSGIFASENGIRRSSGSRSNLQVPNPTPVFIGILVISVFTSFCAAKPVIGGVVLAIAMMCTVPTPFCYWLDLTDTDPLFHVSFEGGISANSEVYLFVLGISILICMERLLRSGDIHNLEEVFLEHRSKGRGTTRFAAYSISAGVIVWSGITMFSYTNPIVPNNKLPAFFDWSLFLSLLLVLFFWKSESENSSGVRSAAAAYVCACYLHAQTARPPAPVAVYAHMASWILAVWACTGFEEASLARFQVTRAIGLAPILAMTVRPLSARPASPLVAA